MLGADLGAVVFGLASALTWGAGDFSGGLLLLFALALLWGEPIPPAASLGWGLAAGLAGAAGVASLYRALAVGQMGLVVSLLATGRSLGLFGQNNVPILGVVENMSYFVCPHSGEQSERSERRSGSAEHS